MEFSTLEDIEAPIDMVFREVSDFEALERAALRRGAMVKRTDDLASKGPGMCWSATFGFRGKERNIDLELVEYDAPNHMACDARANGVDVKVNVDLVALSRRRTRITFNAEMIPTNLSGRLLVQSLKLAKNKLNTRFRVRIAEYAKNMEDSLNRKV